METQRLATMANAIHDPNIARQAVQASQASVNHTNNVATGRSPNTYSPYNSNGNATSYFNSSYQSGKAPSPDAPRIEDVTGDSVQYCSTADRIANIQAFGAGDYSGIANGINHFTELMKVFYNSLEIKAGVGQGFGGSVEIADIGADFEISGNYIEIRVDDGKWHFGQSSKAEASLDLIFADIGGRYIEYYDFNGNLLPNLDNSFSWYSLKLPNGVSASAYFIVGGSVSIEINYSDLMVNWEKYWEGLHE